MNTPPFPTPEVDRSDNPEELRHVIASLRTYSAWQGQALSATQAAHDKLARRASDAADESALEAAAHHDGKEQGEVIEALRTQVTQLREERDEARRSLEQESDTVRDLRLRLADSRRAFMRLQQEGESVRKAVADRRRSTQITGSGLAPSILAAGQQATPPPPENPEEAKAKRASKRASLAFGPNGTISMSSSRNFGRTGHMRTSSSVTSAGTTPATAPAPPSDTSSSQPDRKLRPLSLLSTGSATTPSGSAGASGATTPTVAPTSPLTPPASHGSPPLSNTEESSSGLGINLSGDKKPERTHRRTSSSVSGFSAFSPPLPPRSPSGASTTSSSHATSPQPPAAGNTTPPVDADAEEAADVARRRSRMLGTGTGPTATESTPATLSNLGTERLQAQLNSRGAELERVRVELSRIRDELDEVKEARWASDVCLQALKEYIALLPPEQQAATASNIAGEAPGQEDATADTPVASSKRLHLPPLPVDATASLEPGDEEQALHPPANKLHQSTESWSSKLGSIWRRATTAVPAEESPSETMSPPAFPARPMASDSTTSIPPTKAKNTARSLGLGSLVLMGGKGKSPDPPATVPEEDEKVGTPITPTPLILQHSGQSGQHDATPDTPVTPVPPPRLPPRAKRPDAQPIGTNTEDPDTTATSSDASVEAASDEPLESKKSLSPVPDTHTSTEEKPSEDTTPAHIL